MLQPHSIEWYLQKMIDETITEAQRKAYNKILRTAFYEYKYPEQPQG